MGGTGLLEAADALCLGEPFGTGKRGERSCVSWQDPQDEEKTARERRERDPRA
jgi:hypothetical protein